VQRGAQRALDNQRLSLSHGDDQCGRMRSSFYTCRIIEEFA
jgi:hypothetical protein